MSTRYLKDPNPPTVEATDELRARVAEILRDIERGGLDAARRYSLQFDGWAPDDFVVSDAEFRRAEAELDDELLGHIAFAQNQVRGFAEAQLATMSELEVEMGPGVLLGHRHIPVSAVGAYVPGGRYPMLASSFMTVLVAKLAGVGQVVGCAPPQREGGIHPAMLYAIRTSGVDAVLCLGGVQALAAMAFGLIDGLAPVDMLVGAGNAFVAEAKRQLFGRVGIDLLAGPTEVLVIADEAANEHLEVQVQESKLDLYQSRLSNFGSLFVGREATVVYGDKAVGTNHVLPTSRAARYTGGLWVGKFLKTCTYQRLTAEAPGGSHRRRRRSRTPSTSRATP
jgi:sulfopropanediol 3-dehydrogenase